MYQAIIIFHVIVAISIIGLVLLQQGKGAEAGTAFGSGASGTVFGARGAASFLTRATAVLATLFFCSSLSLAYLSDTGAEKKDIMDETEFVEPSGDLPAMLNEDQIAPDLDIPTDLPSVPVPENAPSTLPVPEKANEGQSTIEQTVEDLPPTVNGDNR